MIFLCESLVGVKKLQVLKKLTNSGRFFENLKKSVRSDKQKRS